MSYQRDAAGNVVLGEDGHPIPAQQGIVEAQHAPIEHKRTSAGGGASAEGVTIGTLIPDPEPASSPKKGS